MKRIISFILLLLTIAVALLNGGCGSSVKTYSDAKKSGEKFLSKHQTEMTALAVEYLNTPQTGVNPNVCEYRGHSYYLFIGPHGKTDDGECQYVAFDVDSQGFVGGQYWSLIFCPDGTFCGQSETYRGESSGNNIEKAEKISGNWWFYWLDTDGTELSQK